MMFNQFKHGVNAEVHRAVVNQKAQDIDAALEIANEIYSEYRQRGEFESKCSSKPKVQVYNVENEKPISSDGSVQNFLKDPNFIAMANAFASYLGISPNKVENSVNSVRSRTAR